MYLYYVNVDEIYLEKISNTCTVKDYEEIFYSGRNEPAKSRKT